MTAPAVLHTALLDLLRGMPTVSVYEGDVPTSPPADAAGRVYPYVVLWPTAGHPPLERPLAGDSGTALEWAPQLTVAAGTTGWLLAAVKVVRDTVEGAALTPWSVLREDPTVTVTVQKDPDTSPVRWFLPLFFHTLTP